MIKKQFEKERLKIEQQNEMAEEEKNNLLKELQDKEERANKEKNKQQKLLKKIKNMEIMSQEVTIFHYNYS